MRYYKEASHHRADQSIVFKSIKNPIADAVMASAKMVNITGKLPNFTVFMLGHIPINSGEYLGELCKNNLIKISGSDY
jgi:hypothetical protein